MSHQIDLNIENYNLNDLLHLFKIPKDFNETHLREAKKIVLKTHPDKSGLDPDYFRFYSKAYKMLFSIWEFKNQSTKQSTMDSKDIIDYQRQNIHLEKDKKKILDQYLKKNNLDKTDNFNTWFNQQFEKNKMENEETANGYGNWLRSDEDLDELKNISQTQMAEEIDKKKQQLKALIVHKEIDEMNSFFTGASNLAGDAPSCYSSDLFSSLPYEDLKKAHTETVVPVTMEDYHNTHKFNDVNEYKNYRNNQNVIPLSEIQAKEYLSNKNRLQEISSNERAFKLAKQLE